MKAQVVEGFTMELINPSTMRVTWVGEATANAIRAMRAYAAASNEELGAGAIVNLLIDGTRGTNMPPEVRRVFRSPHPDRTWERIALIGVRFEIKVTVELILRAAHLMKLDADGVEIQFFATEAEALAWFEACCERERSAS